MQRIITFLTLFLSMSFVHGQSLDGTYFAYELNGLSIDTSGKVNFFMSDSFPAQKWFHQVNVTIKGNNITINKIPVFVDNTGKKWYSASDGGFLTYKGKITKSAGFFTAKTQLVDYDYIGFSLFEPPIIAADADSSLIDKSLSRKNKPPVSELRKTHDVTKGIHGLEVFLPKGTLRQDYILRPEGDGLWINNVFYYSQKSKAPNSSFKNKGFRI